MAIRPVVTAVICVGLFLIFESLMVPKVQAIRADGSSLEDQASHKRRNYMLLRARDNAILRSLQEKRDINYDTELESLDAISRLSKELANIVDHGYANTIDDVFFLKSIGTRAGKGGNIKLEKKANDQAIPDPPCSCKFIEGISTIGNHAFPKLVLNGTCPSAQSGCLTPYSCQEIQYPIPILRMREDGETALSEDSGWVPANLISHSWTVEFVNVTVGCKCAQKFIGSNK